jgi:hypothetical protein
MERTKDKAVETRKAWETPELKKIDVEAVTAAAHTEESDGTFQAS